MMLCMMLFFFQGHCFGGSAYFGIGEPMFVYVQIKALTIGKIFRLAAPNLKLPPPIEETGFPRGATVRKGHAQMHVVLKFS